MVDTVRTIVTLLASLFQDGQAAGSISPNDMRDLIVSLSPPETTLTPSGSIAWNLDTNPIAVVTITSSPVITLSGGAAGQGYRLCIIQGGAGSFTPTFAGTGVVVVGTPSWYTTPGLLNFAMVDVVGSSKCIVVV